MVARRILVIIVFVSGFVSLAYQTVWLREMRLFFGASTPATAAVTGIFMLGLGVGGLVLGRRADLTSTPLRFYGWVEIAISALTVLTLATMPLARAIYLGIGGSGTLGAAGATITRVALAAVIIAPATFAMGATLPAAARSFMRGGDAARSGLGVLYGANTIGAVFGTVAATFYLLERFGQRGTLLLAIAANAVIGATALALSRTESPLAAAAADVPRPRRRLAIRFFALMAGFTFFVMELVWYRMLAPILGGSTYTFGLILAMALAGIGIGGAAYGAFQRARQPSLRLLSATFALQALAVISAWALGDRLAVTAALLNQLSAWGFSGSVLAWTITAFIVVFPTSAVAGYQFPVLVGLAGSGRENVGGDTGEVYLWNTIGALVGALCGGMVLIPAIGATDLWRFTAWAIAALALAVWVLHTWTRRQIRSWATPVVAASAVALGLFATGPTEAWRHSPIGAGRVDTTGFTPQEIDAFLNQQRRPIRWQTDGRESSVALTAADGYAFLVNGKSDGHMRGDNGTQVMSGLLGALLHGSPRDALVIGLGTGSTAGWIAAVPAIEQVDVVEIEPAILHVAEVGAPVNLQVLRNPKVNVIIGDGREVLLTTDRSYDIIFSEPSNPYRAGIASLFTSDFYAAVRPRLREGGLFIQWVQAYEIDVPTLEAIYATIASVFPSVETWQTQRGDLLLVASEEPLSLSSDQLRRRLREQPFREAAARIWYTDELEGVLAHFVATDDVTRTIARRRRPVRDDRNTIEFGFARRNAAGGRVLYQELRRRASEGGFDRRPIKGAVDWNRVDELRLALPSIMYQPAGMTDEQRWRADVTQSWLDLSCSDSIASWSRLQQAPRGPLDLLVLGTCYARLGDSEALVYANALAPEYETEVLMMKGMMAAAAGSNDAAKQLRDALIRHRSDPWAPSPLVEATIATSLETAAGWRQQPEELDTLAEGFSQSFAVLAAEHRRHDALLFLAELREIECGPRTIAALGLYEPHVPWTRQFLERRARCYRRTRHPLMERATADLERFMKHEPAVLSAVATPASGVETAGEKREYTITTGSSAAPTPID